MRVDDADVMSPEETDGRVDPPSQLDPGERDPDDPPAPEPFPDFYFTPVGLHATPGEVVAFPNASDDVHTVTAMHPRFYGLPLHVPETAPPFSSPPVLSAPELAPEHIVERGAVEWSDLGESVEGFDPDELFAEG